MIAPSGRKKKPITLVRGYRRERVDLGSESELSLTDHTRAFSEFGAVVVLECLLDGEGEDERSGGGSKENATCGLEGHESSFQSCMSSHYRPCKWCDLVVQRVANTLQKLVQQFVFGLQVVVLDGLVDGFSNFHKSRFSFHEFIRLSQEYTDEKTDNSVQIHDKPFWLRECEKTYSPC